jgi:hypothetical protein
MKVPSSELTTIAFPNCGLVCAAMEYLGVGECESICGFKFHPCDENCSRKALTQSELDELKIPSGTNRGLTVPKKSLELFPEGTKK